MKEDKTIIDIPMLTREDLADIDVAVWDMDGTFYQHDGENRSFHNSTLHRTILSRSRTFIMDREGVDSQQAQFILEEALLDDVGISRFLSQRYGITRKEYFDVVWNIDPVGIVSDFDMAVMAAREIKKQGKTMILLTAAPEAWMRRVVDFLGLADVFDRVYHGEMYGAKDEIFAVLAGEFDPSRVVSFGDQMYTDIIPAHAVGMKVFHVTHPNSFQTLIGDK